MVFNTDFAQVTSQCQVRFLALRFARIAALADSETLLGSFAFVVGPSRCAQRPVVPNTDDTSKPWFIVSGNYFIIHTKILQEMNEDHAIQIGGPLFENS